MQGPQEADRALLMLLNRLAERDYRFTTITPASHERVIQRRGSEPARSERDVFGWSLPFHPNLLADGLLELLRTGGMLDESAASLRSMVRVSTVRGQNYLHSAYPTSADDAVFLGPDSYRFANLIADVLRTTPARPGARIVDIGVGAGVGAITAAMWCDHPAVVGTDINPKALRLARINAAAAGVPIETAEISGLGGLSGTFDVALLNPPYIIDESQRAYRNGGGMHGGQLSLGLATAALAKLSPRGRLILYTGSAIVGGNDALQAALGRAAEAHDSAMRCWELDPDVFGEELSNPQYAEVDRIALVAAIFTKAG